MEKPRFEISKSKVLEKFDELREIVDSVSYSSKTNPIVTNILEKERDCFFSIHSMNELKNAEDKKRVIFLAQGWQVEEIKFLLEEGVRNFVVDNEGDLEILEKFMLPREEKINLFFRLKLKENTLKTEKYFVFGFTSSFINENVLKFKKKSWVGKIGIHFHRKTQNIAEWNLKREIEGIFDLGVLKKVDLVLMGGGLPSVYANTNTKIFSGIFEKIKEFNEWVNSFGAKVIIEPGRYIAAPAGRLISHVKLVNEKNIILDVSVYNSDMDALVVPVKLLVEGETKKGEGEAYVVKGITPCSMDLFRYRVYLKKEPKVGEKFVFLNAGAYSFTTDFCDLEKIETKIVQ